MSSCNSFNDVTWNNFRFRLLVTCHLRIVVMHLLIKLGADTFIQSWVIDIFPVLKMAAAAILNFQFMWIWPFRRVDSVVFVFCTNFCSNICCSHWDRRTYASDVYLMTSRELTFRFRLLVSWPSPHGRNASFYKIWSRYLYPSRSYWHFFEIKDGGRRHLGFSGYVNSAILACW